MAIRKLLEDDDAVSPVIGVILMVAITVILAAVIASFVLGLGDQASESQPTATFSFDWDGSSELTITHDGGDSIESDRLAILVDGSVEVSTPFVPSGSAVTAGSSETITSGVSSGDQVRVTWQSTDTDSSQTLATYEVP